MSNMQASGTNVMAGLGGDMIVGRSEHALDPKRRLTVPSGWRTAMKSPAYYYVFPDATEKRLTLIDPQAMTERVSRLRERSLFDAESNRALRILGSNTEQLSVDVQGRIRISERLLKKAGITDKVVMIGAVSHGQIWAQELAPEDDDTDPQEIREAGEKANF